jgi:NAD(P)H-dependent flavin oxidoreductase YrpB (nitropropane dioxygenase family)
MVEGDTERVSTFQEYCALCGWGLALAHAKSGDAASIAGYCGNSEALDEAIATFSLAYAKQTERDHEALNRARRSGRIRVASERLTK